LFYQIFEDLSRMRATPVGGIGDATGRIPNDLSPSGGRIHPKPAVNRRARKSQNCAYSNLSHRQFVTIGKVGMRRKSEAGELKRPCGRKPDSVLRCPFERSKSNGVTTRSSRQSRRASPMVLRSTKRRFGPSTEALASRVSYGRVIMALSAPVEKRLACILLSWLTTSKWSAWPASRSSA